MNAKEYLEQVECLQKRISRKEKELRELRMSADGLTGMGSCGMAKTVSPAHHKTEIMACRIITLEEEIKENQKKLEALQKEMQSKIQRIKNPEIRDVMTKRYLEFKPWNKIRKEMNCCDSTCYRLHRAGLKALEN